MKTRIIMLTALLAVGLPWVATAATRSAPADPSDDIRQALLWLPYYGPFDAISFQYDKGTVTLEGRAYAPGLEGDAERAVKRVAGVDTVINHIQPLPPSPNDDSLRWRAFYAIYTNDFLARYVPGGGFFLHGLGGLRRERALGLEPFGTYPIHIVVERGHIQLLGWVSTEADKTAAGLAAQGVAGSFGVDNGLQVYPTT